MTLTEVPTIAFSGNEHALLARVASLGMGQRVILGVCGPPGAGKSTLAAWLAQTISTVESRVVSMDGFHLSNSCLRAQGLRERKGAIETFDGDGYAALLTRLRQAREPIVYCPGFDRAIEEPIAASVAVERAVPLVITEGNYLLADGPAWEQARGQMDEVWFVDIDPQLRQRRLIDRHVEFGKTRSQAAAWVDSVDESNAQLVADSRHRAQLAIKLSDDIDITSVD